MILFLCICAIFPWSAQAQKNKKMEDKYDYAKKSYTKGDVKQVLKVLNEIIIEDSTYADPYLLMAEMYYNNEKIKEMTDTYVKLVKNCGSNYPNGYFLLANTQMYSGQIQEAKENYKIFLNQKNVKPELKKMAESMIAECDFSLDLISKPVPFNPQNLGDSVNSVCDEYYPYLSPDEQTLVITRKVPMFPGADPSSDNTQEDFYICH